MMQKTLPWLPLTGLLLLLVSFGYSFYAGRDPMALPSALLSQPIPVDVELVDLFSQRKITAADFQGQVTVLNFFASWCVPCRIEHPELKQLARDYPVQMIGFVYKDSAKNIRQYIQELGNPYDVLHVPPVNNIQALDWGITGVPETFVIDRQGIIRYRLQGAIDATMRREILAPLLRELLRP
jgi:cytochrome c biogenesis protein CcmG, thiol:disulfide interchange protein DsbE